MEFLSLIRRRSFARNVPSGKERGETRKERNETCNLQKVCKSSDSLYGNRYIFLDGLVCSIVGYCYESRRISAISLGESKYKTFHRN